MKWIYLPIIPMKSRERNEKKKSESENTCKAISSRLSKQCAERKWCMSPFGTTFFPPPVGALRGYSFVWNRLTRGNTGPALAPDQASTPPICRELPPLFCSYCNLCTVDKTSGVGGPNGHPRKLAGVCYSQCLMYPCIMYHVWCVSTYQYP